MLIEAIGDFKKKDTMSIIAGVSVVGKMLGTIDTDLRDCRGMGPDIKRIKVWSAVFKDPVALFKKAFANTLINLDNINKDVGKIIHDAQHNHLH